MSIQEITVQKNVPATMRDGTTLVAHHQVFHDPDRPSHVTLAVVDG